MGMYVPALLFGFFLEAQTSLHILAVFRFWKQRKVICALFLELLLMKFCLIEITPPGFHLLFQVISLIFRASEFWPQFMEFSHSKDSSPDFFSVMNSAYKHILINRNCSSEIKSNESRGKKKDKNFGASDFGLKLFIFVKHPLKYFFPQASMSLELLQFI